LKKSGSIEARALPTAVPDVAEFSALKKSGSIEARHKQPATHCKHDFPL